MGKVGTGLEWPTSALGAWSRALDRAWSVGCSPGSSRVRPKQTPRSARLAAVSFTALCAPTLGGITGGLPIGAAATCQVLALSPGSLAALKEADSGLCVSVKNKECADGSHPDNTGKEARHSKQPGFNLLQPSLADEILMSYVRFNLHHRHLPFSPDKISNKKGKGVVGEM